VLFHVLSVRKHKTHQSDKSTTSDERLRCTLHEIVKNYLARIWLALARIWRSAAPPRKLYLVISILHVIRIPILLCFFKKRGDGEVWSEVQRRALLDRTKHGYAEGAKNADNSKRHCQVAAEHTKLQRWPQFHLSFTCKKYIHLAANRTKLQWWP